MERIGRSELKDRVFEIIEASYTITSALRDEYGCWVLELNDGHDSLTLTTYIKNVSSAYLSYDANVDRIQIPPIPSIHKTQQGKIFLLIGYKNIDEDGLLVCWDPQRYVNHAKYRSAYIYQKNLNHGIENGFYTTTDHNNKIYVCKKGFFNKVVETYTTDSLYKEFEW